MKKNILIALFLLFCIAQISVPGYMYIQALTVASQNKVVKLQCGLYDPSHFMKGRYLHLSFPISRQKLSIFKEKADLKQLKASLHNPVYCVLKKMKTFHVIDYLTLNKPSGDLPFIKTSDFNIYDDEIFLNFDFERYYLQENLAPKAEKILAGKDIKKLNPLLVLYIDNGSARIKALTVNNMDIDKYTDK